ncbi:TonB-dependent hemoglobin/transferrin/lactoferrin family receptor [Luteimonas sp. 8-5]|uniref:TonB-dependent hemoglobin/transferrin/lactoferrin family receptor n=1 Tax=Luteimonas sp. 8-5 TaxID=3039387 RepID=UPI0024362EA9|nr:TonB-dependent hemoglobin/transferrin/lactoferrin family receptor [Luteimonas sp. 8-5]MDG6348201.1 TonB-dependent hemoglobin/transferrin/lactoferrin family receptor [Luteimonas sp. 8-5]
MRLHPLSLALLLALPAAATAADAPANAGADSDSAADLKRVVVVATRTERAEADVPATVDAIDRERMDQLLAHDLASLFRYEPGISVTSGFGRFGIGSIRIRGLDANRVRIQVDGIPVSDAWAIGSYSDANRNFIDVDTLKRAEVVRGPASSLYGSDALGGTVAFTTKDPSDYLTDGKDSHVGVRLGTESSWNALTTGATVAIGGERWSGMAVVNHRQGQETENQGEIGGEGATRTQPNPQDRDGRSLVSKLVFAPSADQRFRLTVEGNEQAADTDMLTGRGLQALTGANNLSLDAHDHQSRARVSFAHEMDAAGFAFADSLDWQVYRQDSATVQETVEVRRTSTGRNERREREFDFDQRAYGLQANFRKDFETGGASHALAYGIDLSRTRTAQKRDGRVHNLDTGTTSNAMLPDVFPVRDFPVSETTNAAFYIQDEIEFRDGDFRLVPAVRVDRYELDAEADPIFAEDNPGVAVEGLTDNSVSPKLGAVWRFAPDWSVYGGYAHGFRAPPYGDVNIGFTNVMFGYTAIANPNLKPETSDGLELGLRFNGSATWATLSAYDNRYHDFIESFAFVGFNDDGLMVFQSRNVANVLIRGAELKAGASLGAIHDALEGWSLRFASAYARGEDRDTGLALDSVDPLTATLGAAYDAGDWGVELAGRFAARKDRVSDPALYRQAGYGVFDLLAHYEVTPGARISFGVFNLADRKYTLAGDLPLGASGTSNVLDRYSAPGRNVSVDFAVAW